MYQDAQILITNLIISNPFIKSISFSSKGYIKVGFTFMDNKLKYDSFETLLEAVDKINEIVN